MHPESAPIVASAQLDADPIRRTLLLGVAGIGVTMLLDACSSGGGHPAAANTAPASPANTASPNHASPNQTPNLAGSGNPDLQLLSAYETALGRRLPEAMSFMPMPTDEQSAAELAERTAAFASDCKTAGVAPRFIMEPNDSSEQGIDLHNLTSPAQMGALRSYLQALKAKGVSGKDLGTFIPLPEPSLPDEWKGGTDPALFRGNFTAVAGLMKEVFPDVQICMMLDSASFPGADWGARTYEAGPLLEYASSMPAGLVDEFGLQGFPRVSGTMDPHKLVNHTVALQAAARTGAKRLWINTGTYSQENDPDSGKIVNASPESRGAFLGGIAQEVAAMRAAGMPVRVNLFASDKLAAGEANWHYTSDELTSIVKPFADQVASSGASLMVFDERS